MPHAPLALAPEVEVPQQAQRVPQQRVPQQAQTADWQRDQFPRSSRQKGFESILVTRTNFLIHIRPPSHAIGEVAGGIVHNVQHARDLSWQMYRSHASALKAMRCLRADGTKPDRTESDRTRTTAFKCKRIQT